MTGPNRRQFIIGAALVAGALTVGAVDAHAETQDFGAFGPFLAIAPDGKVTVTVKHSELGQGSHTGLAVIVADELDADWAHVAVVMAPADMAVYGHTRLKIQITGGSSTIANSWDQLRGVGATARAMLVAAAAQKWQVPAGEITVSKGVVSHAPSNRHAGFGDLVTAAAQIPPPADPVLKTPAQYTLIGKPGTRRVDASAKSTGVPIYTQDVDLPGLLVAVVLHPPRFGGKVKSFDPAPARKIAGVIDVFEIPTGIAVVANTTWAAMQGRAALTATWDDSAAEMRSSPALHAAYQAIAADPATAWAPFETAGDIDAAFAGPGETVRITLDFPYLAHAAMEPMNCVAQVDGTRAKLTFGAQNQTTDQKAVAALLGGTVAEVEIVTLPAGGSFGRRSIATSEYQTECVSIAKRIGGFRPVKLVRTREDDMAGGGYRPMSHVAIDVRVDAAGYPVGWRHRMVSQSLAAGTPLAAGVKNGVDRMIVEGAMGSPYFKAIPAVDARAYYPPSPITVCWLRSVGSATNAMIMEHAIDQLAHHAKIDPVEYRRTLFRKAGADRQLAALNLVAEKSGWGKPLGPGWARGVAVHDCFGTIVANVVEVSVKDGAPIVRRVVLAVDCGTVVTPDIVTAQMESGVFYGLSYDLFGEVKLADGVVETTNFDTYRVLRFDEAPRVETYIVPSTAPPTGVGEPGTPVVGPAVANALLALTGKPTLALPLVKA